MSVAIGRAIRDGLRARGVTVHESPGPGVYVARPGSWEGRGNGQTSRYKGLVVHHTAGNFGRDYSTLYNGRSDLPGPLCNTSGNEDGSVTMIAAHPANHAGASGGWDTAPLPRTSSFNAEVWGHEICYPGTVPMRDAQYRTATILGRVVCDVLGVPESHIKFHQGTSVTGKWDPGYANGKTYDIAAFRREAASVQAGVEEDMTPDQARQLSQIWAMAQQNAHGVTGGWGAGANLLSELDFRAQVLARLDALEAPATTGAVNVVPDELTYVLKQD
ncbi:MAG: N-acetylmuramoyl-L-alanine amidase [Gemmatimonadota bacterium]|nr:N-acetylmuramoyl-L-alanine amidase [Gemmatimonadota bacterium]